MTDVKTCQWPACGVEFARPKGSASREWAARRFCSRSCYDLAKVKPLGPCERPGCEEMVKHRGRRFCSLRCASLVQHNPADRLPHAEPRPRPVCAREGCEVRVTGPQSKYCSRECSSAARRTAVCVNGHDKDQAGPCRECKRLRDVARSAALKAARPKPQPRAAGPRRSRPSAPPPPALPQVGPAEGRPVWRPAGIDRWAARGGPGDPATRRGTNGATGPINADTTPVGVSAGAVDTVDLVAG